jgi:diaminopimelate decarboxylase
MAGTYNSRPLAPEVLVDGDQWSIVRPRKDVEDFLSEERLPPWLLGFA